MAEFINKGEELEKLGKVIGGMYTSSLLFEKKMSEIEDDDYSEFTESILTLAYYFRRGVTDNIARNKWSPEHPIIVVAINKNEIITVNEAVKPLLEKILTFAMACDIEEVVDNILKKRSAYYEFENMLPDEVLNQMVF